MLKIFQTIAAFNYTFIHDYLVISKASLISGVYAKLHMMNKKHIVFRHVKY